MFNEVRFGNLSNARTEGMMRAEKQVLGVTPLIAAAGQDSVDAVKLLLAAGADPNARGNGGATALHVAANKDHVAIIRALLDKGADPNVVDPEGNTALIIAAASDSLDPEIIRTLLDKGAKVKFKAPNNETALSWARRRGDTAVVKLLRQASAAE